MEKYYFKNENQKNNQLEIFNTPKRQRSFKNLKRYYLIKKKKKQHF